MIINAFYLTPITFKCYENEKIHLWLFSHLFRARTYVRTYVCTLLEFMSKFASDFYFNQRDYLIFRAELIGLICELFFRSLCVRPVNPRFSWKAKRLLLAYKGLATRLLRVICTLSLYTQSSGGARLKICKIFIINTRMRTMRVYIREVNACDDFQ